ncbi:MAG: hypothetical protein ACXWID_12625, partial [Pyrinomonadaceae bacterium]
QRGSPAGVEARLPDLETANLLDEFTLKAIHECDHSLDSNQPGVRKVGLPPLFLSFLGKAVLTTN